MAENIIVKKSLDKVIVTFQSTVDLESFEFLLKKAYSATVNKKVRDITFDLSYVTWIEPFQVSQIALWICELVSDNRKVGIVYPERKRVIQFLEQIHFGQSLTSPNIKL